MVSADELGQELQRVVCPVGLSPPALVGRLDELTALTSLACLASRGGGETAEDRARAVAALVREAVGSLEQGPSRRAAELLLGIGRTRGLLRKARRSAAAAELEIGVEHFRKYRELPLLTEVAEEILALEATSPPAPEHPAPVAAPGPAPAAAAGTSAPPVTGTVSRARSRRRRSLATGLALATAVATVAWGADRLGGGPAGTPAGPPAGPLVAGDSAQFVRDVTVPDGMAVPRGHRFLKTWEIRNSGRVTWSRRWLQRRRATGTVACATPGRVAIPTTRPGGDARISVPVTAPRVTGSCRVDWKMTDAAGRLSFPNERGIWFIVRVTG